MPQKTRKPLFTLKEGQRTFGLDKCYEILNNPEGNHRCLLYGDPGVGKTPIVSFLIKEHYLQLGPVFLYMQSSFFDAWKRDLPKIIANFKEVNVYDRESWDSGTYLEVSTAVKNEYPTELRQCVRYLSVHRRSDSMIYLIDLNYLWASTTARVFEILKIKTEVNDFSYHILESLHLIMHHASFLGIDEIDVIRSGEGKNWRDTINTHVKTYYTGKPVLFITATPLGGQDKDVQQVAEMLGTTVEFWNNKVVRITQTQALDTSITPSAVGLVNISDAGKWLAPNVREFIEKVVDLYAVKTDENNKDDEVRKTNIANNDFFWDLDRIYATIYCAMQCIDTYDPSTSTKTEKTSCVIMVERINFAGILKLILDLMYHAHTQEELNILEPSLRGYFTFQDLAGKYLFFKPHAIETLEFIVHTSQKPKLARGLADVDIVPEKEVSLYREKLYDSKLPVYIGGIKADSKSWSAVSSNKKDRIVLLFPHGMSDDLVEMRQAVGRNHRASSHGLGVSLVFGTDSIDDNKCNFIRFAKKVGNITTHGKDWRQTVDMDLFERNHSEWLDKYFPHIPQALFDQALFQTTGVYLPFPYIPLEHFSEAMQASP